MAIKELLKNDELQSNLNGTRTLSPVRYLAFLKKRCESKNRHLTLICFRFGVVVKVDNLNLASKVLAWRVKEPLPDSCSV